MLTILEALNLSAEYLKKKGIESPRMNAELLLAGVLDCKRLNLYLSFDKPLKKFETDIYREYISRRGKFEPLQYILGKVEFYGLEFIVNKNVLIPRQETEILVEAVIENIKSNDKTKVKILDIGTGSGNIPICLAKHLGDAEIYAVDISDEALKVAMKNSELNDVKDKIKFINADVLDDNFDIGISEFDVIVSNPPYVSADETENLQKEITDYEPRVAVTDNNDGLRFYRRISELGKKMLSENGLLFFEVGIDQADEVKEIMNTQGYKSINLIKDYLDIDRVVTGEK